MVNVTLSREIFSKGGFAARWKNPPLKGGMPKAGGKIDTCLLITLESHKQTSINHPIRRLRRHLPHLGKADHRAAFGRHFPSPALSVCFAASFPEGKPTRIPLESHMRLLTKGKHAKCLYRQASALLSGHPKVLRGRAKKSSCTIHSWHI